MRIKGNIKEVKQGLRQKCRAYRESLSPQQKQQMDAAIRTRLFRLSVYRQSRILFTYVSKPIEVDTIAIIRHALTHGRQVAVPRCIPGTHRMQFYFIHSLDDLTPGTFGVLEPDIERCQPVTDLSQGLCIVPGLSFDSQGYRLGYGKGYYDRFLAAFGGSTIGICYRNCAPWKLPHGYYDCPVDLLITEKYIRNIHRAGKHASSRQEVRHG